MLTTCSSSLLGVHKASSNLQLLENTPRVPPYTDRLPCCTLITRQALNQWGLILNVEAETRLSGLTFIPMMAAVSRVQQLNFKMVELMEK